MCIQRSSERIEEKSRMPQSGWKIVPQSRTGCRETPVAKFVVNVVCSWHEQLPNVVGMRPQRTTTSVRQKMTDTEVDTTLWFAIDCPRSNENIWIWPNINDRRVLSHTLAVFFQTDSLHLRYTAFERVATELERPTRCNLPKNSLRIPTIQNVLRNFALSHAVSLMRRWHFPSDWSTITSSSTSYVDFESQLDSFNNIPTVTTGSLWWSSLQMKD